MTIKVATLVLSEMPASLLLSCAETASFAMAAKPDGMTIDELCERVVRVLARPGAHAQERAMACVAAITVGRYDSLIRAMERAKMEPVVIEDLVDYGYDLGLAEGLEKGLEKGRVIQAIAALLAVLAARSLALTPPYEQRVRSCTEPARLASWLRRAVTASSIEEVFADEDE